MEFSFGFQASILLLLAAGFIGFCRACCYKGRIPSLLQVVILIGLGVGVLDVLAESFGPNENYLLIGAMLLIAWMGGVGRREKDWILSPLQVFTLGVFFAVFFFFLPVSNRNSDLAGNLSWGFVAEALHRTLRVFVVDIDFDVLKQALAEQSEQLQNTYQTLGLVLYVLAPVLLFSNLLLLFRDMWSEMRYFLVTFSPIYIFSELNSKSIALAEDIFRKPPKTRFPWLRRVFFPPVLVFTEVYSQNRERDQELLSRAKALRAICLKKDVAQLEFQDKWSRIEIFLMGDKEDENMSQAMTIMERLKKQHKKKVQLYVFSRKESDGCILDSLEYGVLEKALRARKRRLLWREKLGKKVEGTHNDRYCFPLHDGKSFSLRRVDAVQHLIWTAVPEMKLLAKAKENGGELSVLILGFGSYGQEFFKMLTWYCQFEDIHLKLTVVDQQKEPGLRSLIDRQCPELLTHNRMSQSGDAQYDIELLSGVDMRGGEFARMMDGTGWLARRLQKTDLAFVSMGDDDLNVETALYLRTLTDRVRGLEPKQISTAEQEPVQIYAVVFDETKSQLLRADKKNQSSGREEGFFLKNHKGELLHIRFLGGLKEQFCYDRINWQKLEAGAYYHHRSWEETTARIWAEKPARERGPEPAASTGEQELQEKLNYHKYEYYRSSSIAKQLYYREVREELPNQVRCLKEGKQTCRCENCVRRKKSEHMRWNAYMRVCGWSYGQRNDRAKLHKDLVSWDQLRPDDQLKD